MKIPVKFVSPLEEEQTNQLKSMIKTAKKPRIRQRAHAILLSSENFSIDEIAKICGVGRDTVSGWIDNWEQLGFEGLNDKPRPGGPSILIESEKQLVIELAKEHPRSIPTLIAKVFEITKKRVSHSTIKRILKAAGQRWKRIKKSMKNKRDEDSFSAAQLELQELSAQHKNGEIELWFFDESGFDGQPSVPYAWQPKGETIEVPSERTKRLNVLGFLTPDQQFESFCFQGTVNTDVVVAGFDEFAGFKSTKTRIVIIDNASTHTSYEFIEKLADWEKKGVIVKMLPTYCSELNLIETLWRFIKYLWLPFSAYLSFDSLVNELENVLKQIGSELRINFAF
jgi:transposase